MDGKHKRVVGAHKYLPTSHKKDMPWRRRRKRFPAMVVALVVATTGPAIAAYRIQPGDTLSGLAWRFNTTVTELARINKIQNPDLIYAGDALRLHKQDRRVRPARSLTRQASPTSSTGPIPTAGDWNWHSGYANPAADISIPGSVDCGNPVRSTIDGTVSQTIWGRTSYGNHVIIGNTLYAHLSDIDVVEGQHVARGQHIGNVGSTGNSTGCHLHYEYGRR